MSITETTRKVAADQLADFIARNESSTSDILERMEAFRIRYDADGHTERAADKYIGIWKEDPETGAYVRDKKQMAEWIKWANQHKIHIATNLKRILLTGESVARGSFYGNDYSPAAILDHILTKAADNDRFEITDLAKSGMEPDEMLELLKEAAILQPSQVIIMAGNNFFYKLYGNFLHAQLTAELPAEELSGKWLKGKIDEALTQIVTGLLKQLSELFVQKGIPVLFVIPAFNLADWKVTAHETGTPVLSAEDAALWNQHWQDARQAHANGDYNQLSALAEQLLALDPTQPAIYELLGETAIATGRWEEARKHLETARDYTLLFRSIGKPRILSAVYHTILSNAANFKIDTIDLAAELAANTDNAIPGRNFFMDYCHMNMPGIQLCMSTVATAIAERLNIPGEQHPLLKTYAAEVNPSAESHCMAHIYAAIHNAHYGQAYPIVRFHIDQAFAAKQTLAAEFCKAYIDMASRRLPSPLTRSFVDIMDNVHAGIDKYPEAVFHPLDGKLMDLVLTDAMNDALVTAGLLAPEATAALRLSEHGVEQHGTVNLLETFYARNTYDNFPELSGYYISRNITASFNFLTDATKDLTAQIVYRTRYAANSEVKLLLNDQPLHGQLTANEEWQTATISIPHEQLRKGVNNLLVHWPVIINRPPAETVLTMRQALDILLPVRGEIHSFTISIA